MEADIDGVDSIREIALIFEQLEVSVRAAKERAAKLALSYRGLDTLVLSARLVDLSESIGDVQTAASVTIHHLRNCAQEVLLVKGG